MDHVILVVSTDGFLVCVNVMWTCYGLCGNVTSDGFLVSVNVIWTCYGLNTQAFILYTQFPCSRYITHKSIIPPATLHIKASSQQVFYTQKHHPSSVIVSQTETSFEQVLYTEQHSNAQKSVFCVQLSCHHILAKRHGVKTGDTLDATVLKPPSQTTLGVSCLVFQILERRIPVFIVGDLG